MATSKPIHSTLYTARADLPDGRRLNETLVIEATMEESPASPETTLTIYGPGGKVLGRNTNAQTQTARVY